MVDGFYRVAFTGNYGSGFGLLVLRDGKVAGADISGSICDGTYGLNGPVLTISIIMRAPAGITPVQTGVPTSSPSEMPISVSVPTDFGDGRPVLVETPLGKVNVAFVKIRDF